MAADDEHLRYAIANAQQAASRISAETGYGPLPTYGDARGGEATAYNPYYVSGGGGRSGAPPIEMNPYAYYGSYGGAGGGEPAVAPAMAPTTYTPPPGYSLVPTANIGTSGVPTRRGRSRSRSQGRSRGRSRSRSPARRISRRERSRSRDRSRSRERARGRTAPPIGDDSHLVGQRPDMVYIQFPKDYTISDAILRNPVDTGERDMRRRDEVPICNVFIATGRCLHRQFCPYRHIDDPREFHAVRATFMRKECKNHHGCRFSVICPYKHDERHFTSKADIELRVLERKVKNYERITTEENAFLWKWMFISSEETLAKQHLAATRRDEQARRRRIAGAS